MATSSSSCVIRGGYWRSFEPEPFPPKPDLVKTYFTHLFYATVAIDPIIYDINPSTNEKERMKEFTSKAHELGLKCLLSVGEDTDPDKSQVTLVALCNMVRTPESRKTFIDSSTKVARENGFDGLDLFWKYPDTETEFEMPNLSLLFKEWRESIRNESSEPEKRLLLSTIAYFAPKFFPPNDDKAYPFKAIKDNVDLISCATITMEARTLKSLLNMLCSMTKKAKRALIMVFHPGSMTLGFQKGN